MKTTPDTTGDEDLCLDALFDCLASSDRRQLLGRLYDRAPDSLTRRDLATYLVPESHKHPGRDESGNEVQRAFTSIHHTHIPKLVAAGVVDEDSDRNTVTITDHPAFQDTGIVDVIKENVSADSESLDVLFGALADDRRRTILDVLSHQFGAIHLETLARELVANDQETTESEVSTEDVEQILVCLHHVDLPHLSEAGLVEYDAKEQMVAYKGHPDLYVPWMHSVLEPDFRPSLTGESEPSGIGEIKGRERVISFGQSLCDRADEELFCMFTDTQLLEAGCLTRIRDASRERGVDVYLGTRDPTIRKYVKENAPEVILWEPNTDWLNLPVAGDKVGRLLLADREAIMLGTLLEKKTDGFHEEQAIVGEGEHNTLVTMVCQLLGPHLEEIDQGTENIEARLPL